MVYLPYIFLVHVGTYSIDPLSIVCDANLKKYWSRPQPSFLLSNQQNKMMVQLLMYTVW